MWPILFIVIPFIFALLAFALGSKAKYAALIGSSIQLILTIAVLLIVQIEKPTPKKQTALVKEYPVLTQFIEVKENVAYDSGHTYQRYQAKNLTYQHPWIKNLGINFNLKLDGIALMMLLLTNLLVPIIFISASKKEWSRAGLFYGLALIMQGAMVGVFVAADAFLYYIFWELSLIPIYIITLLWGGENRSKITFKFFIYTLFGSLLMLFAIILAYLYTPARSFALESFYGLNLPMDLQTIVFFGFMIAYAVKIPIFPFHTWQADTYETAPNQGTMLLSGIMLKMALYSIIRWVWPVVPQATSEYSHWIIGLAIIGMIYASMMALVQKNIKRVLAYSSMAHVGLIAAGVLTLTHSGWQGAFIQMLSHGIIAVGLFYICDILWDRYKTYDIDEMGGSRKLAPNFAVLFLIVTLASISLPLTSNFVGEFMLLKALSYENIYYAVFAGLTVILGAVYMLRLYQKTTLGEKQGLIFADVKGTETSLLVTLVLLIFVVGILSQVFLNIVDEDLIQHLDLVKQKLNTYHIQ